VLFLYIIKYVLFLYIIKYVIKECVRSDMKDLGLRAVDAKDRELWRGKIFSETSKPRKRRKNDVKH